MLPGMGHNPPVWEWRSRHPSIGFADQLTVNRRGVGRVVLAEEDGVFSYVGVVGMHVTSGFDTVEEAQEAVEVLYGNLRWGPRL
jgi:hypothetical protein